LGLLFAGNGSYTIGCKASNVFNQLNIELLSRPYGIVLDLSHYNGTMTAGAVTRMKELGVKGVILKCSQGDYYKDVEFDNSATLCEAGGMPWAPYHWNDPDISAAGQYAWFIKCLGNFTPSFQPMVDCEDKGNCNADKITSVTMALLKLIDDKFKPLGYKPPIVYTRGSWCNTYFLRSDDWKYYPLDAARYYVDQVKYSDTDAYFPYDWDKATLWQCEADGDYLGLSYFFGTDSKMSKHVDVNYILDNEEWESWLVHVPEEPEEPEEPEIPEEPEEPTLKTAVHYFGKTLVGLNVRNAPSTSGTKLGTMSAGTQFEWFEEVKEGSNIWLRIGWKQYAAKVYNGNTYIEYITV
jgi:GH25 family lysozyme M1 (1,4-beta-N-acetylmuramidase)